MNKALAAMLQPELQALIKANDVPPGDAYSPDAAACAKRAAKNKALAALATLETPEVRFMACSFQAPFFHAPG